MKRFETRGATWETDDLSFRLRAGDVVIEVPKVELAQALVGLGIVHTAVVRHSKPEEPTA